MKRTISFRVIMMLLISGSITVNIHAQAKKDAHSKQADQQTLTRINELKRAVEAHPDSLKVHEAYIKAVGIANPQLVAQYKVWMSRFPRNVNFPLAIGTAFCDAERPEAGEYLLKCARLDPKNPDVWSQLSYDAERQGKTELAKEYMHRASLAAPGDVNLAYYDFDASEGSDDAKYAQDAPEFAKRFPDNERGAQALYWAAIRTEDKAARKKIYEQQLEKYSPLKFNWSATSAENLFFMYLPTDPQKALQLSARLVSRSKRWVEKREIAIKMLSVDSLAAKGDFNGAYKLFRSIEMPPYRPDAQAFRDLRSAELQERSGNVQDAYETLLAAAAKLPTDTLYATLNYYGSKLGKNMDQVRKEIKEHIYANATNAPFFELYNYFTKGKLNLDDLKGKVVLVTFWFPGCGPCRAEMPYFQQVMNKYSHNPNVAYIGINANPDQDSYVLSFVKNTGFSFTPLRTDKHTGNDFTAFGAPSNFVLDKNGRIVYRNFRIDRDNCRTLELMINSVL